MAGGAHGWRVPPAAAADRIVWPADFGQRFIVFVDTEEEFDWTLPFSRDARSVRAISALPMMHDRFAARGIAPCYLCDYPVVTDEGAVEVLRDLVADGRSTIGAQLHPWVNPPHVEEPSAHLSFAGNLAPNLEAAKLDKLTAAIGEAFGQAPLAFRAGRYGLGPRTLDLLAGAGYQVDTSMRSRHDYSQQGGPDYRGIAAEAFRTGPNGAIVEVPLTTLYTGALRRQGPLWHVMAGYVPHGRGLLARTGLLSRVPLTPEGVSVAEARVAIEAAVRDALPLLSFSFHSPSLVPGNTPYVRDDADLVRFHEWWEVVLDLLDRLDVRPISLGELIAASDGLPRVSRN